MSVSIVTIFHGDKEFIPLIKYNYKNLTKDKENITKFDFYKKNADSVLFQRDYEENEPVSFKLSI